MDVYQRAWASLLKRIEAKTSWGRNELKNEMLGALVDADPREEAMAGRDFHTPQGVDYPAPLPPAPLPYVDADAVQRKAQNDV